VNFEQEVSDAAQCLRPQETRVVGISTGPHWTEELEASLWDTVLRVSASRTDLKTPECSADCHQATSQTASRFLTENCLLEFAENSEVAEPTDRL